MRLCEQLSKTQEDVKKKDIQKTQTDQGWISVFYGLLDLMKDKLCSIVAGLIETHLCTSCNKIFHQNWPISSKYVSSFFTYELTKATFIQTFIHVAFQVVMQRFLSKAISNIFKDVWALALTIHDT